MAQLLHRECELLKLLWAEINEELADEIRGERNEYGFQLASCALKLDPGDAPIA